MEHPDTISIAATGKRTLKADTAKLVVVIEGSSMFSGMKTFKKADEVQSLIKALQADGISEEDVSVVNVQLETDNSPKSSRRPAASHW